MIINTGQRTDIPAFYAKWFANRIKAGFVLVRNPYNPQMVTRYQLDPEVVDAICFCTKNPEPMLPYMQLLRPYGQFWYVTITPYGKEIEPHVPEKKKVLETFSRISDIVGPDAMGWRYDPIFLSEKYPAEKHLEAFEAMAVKLKGYTHTAVISFIDLYQKTKKNFPEAKEVRKEERLALGKAMIEIARDNDMTLRPCMEGDELEPYGADCSGCMTIPMYEKALGTKLKVPAFKPAREGCACYLGADIGAYNSCGHMCRYCYANYDAESVRLNRLLHDPDSPLMIGHLEPEDKVHDALQKSWRDDQLRLEL